MASINWRRLVSYTSYSVFGSSGDLTDLPIIPGGVHFRSIFPADLDSLCSYSGDRSVEFFRGLLLDSNSAGILVELDGVVVGHAWRTSSSESWNRFNGYFPLQAGESLIHHCRVAESSRGRGLFTQLIIRSALASSTRRVLIDAERANTASIQGIRRAGFHYENDLHVMRVAGRAVKVNAAK